MRPVTIYIYIYLCGGGRTAAGWTGQGFGKWNFSAARFNGNCRRKRRDKAFLIDTIELLVSMHSRRGLSYFSVSVIVNGWSKGISWKQFVWLSREWWLKKLFNNVQSIFSYHFFLVLCLYYFYSKIIIFLSTFTFLIIDKFSKDEFDYTNIFKSFHPVISNL